MPVWNGEDFVAEAVQSVLDQSYRDFELIVVDDHSTDGTPEVLRSFRDGRLRVLRNDQNMGVSRSLLMGIESSRGIYLARMDADDVCLKSRLARQVRFMERHEDVDVLGGAALLFGRSPLRLKAVARNDPDIKTELLFRSPLIHPTVMFRMSSIRSWYDPHLNAAEDYDLWARLASNGCIFANLRVPVIRYRMHGMRTSEVRTDEQTDESVIVRESRVRILLGRLSESDSRILASFASRSSSDSRIVIDALSFSRRLIRGNDKERLCSRRALRKRAALEASILVLGGRGAWRHVLRGDRGDLLWFLTLCLQHPSAVVSAVSYVLPRRIRASREVG